MCFKLISIENPHIVHNATDNSFLFLLQRGALLGLKDVGLLTPRQMRYAEDILLQHYKYKHHAQLPGDPP